MRVDQRVRVVQAARMQMDLRLARKARVAMVVMAARKQMAVWADRMSLLADLVVMAGQMSPVVGVLDQRETSMC